MIVLRSTLFNLLFYALTAAACILALPALLLPRGAALWVLVTYQKALFLVERVVMGITLEVRGRENIPAHGAYLVAAKHQSPYETMKLHLIFPNPSVVLKKELMEIPLWGWYAARIGMIPIDRSAKSEAMKSLIRGAHLAIAEERPIVIFPQGTRVAVGQSAKDRPYRHGVARIQEATGLPILPMALNSGLFWPRKGWLRRPGTVVFSILPPIAPGKSVAETMAEIEKIIEDETEKLVRDSSVSPPAPAPTIAPTPAPTTAPAPGAHDEQGLA